MQNIISAFDNFSLQIDGNDKFLFFFSGSGLVDDPPIQNFSANIQTSHNYNPNTNQKWSINHTDSHAIRVHFSQFNTEYGLDTLYMSDNEDVSPVNFEKRYSGDLGSDFWSDYIPTTNNSIHFQFTSNSAVENYGFQIDKYQILNSSSDSQGICLVDYFENNSDFINDTLLNQKLNQLNSSKNFVFLDSDFSGGMLTEISNNNIFAMSSTNKTEYSLLDSSYGNSVFYRFFEEAFYLNEVDSNQDGFNSLEEIYLYVNSSASYRASQIDEIIHPQFYNGFTNQSFIFPAIFNTEFNIIGNVLYYNFSLEGIFYPKDVNLLIYSSSDNTFSNTSLDPSSISDSGYGNYTGIIDNEKSITTIGITSNINTSLSLPFFIYFDQKNDLDNDSLTDIQELFISTNPLENDTDFDDLTDAFEFYYGTNPVLNDTDADGMPDGWEYQYSLLPLNSSDNFTDPDSDQVPNIYEFLNGTNPKNDDTDFDNIGDLWEILNNLNPIDPTDNISDFDNDGMLNIWEYSNSTQTDPWDPDCDDDLINDYWEWANGTNPWNNDTDYDGLLDGEEILTYFTNPLLSDTDGDGLIDGREVKSTLTKPLINDTDGDGILDGGEVDFFFTDPLNPDHDGDGLLDGEEVILGEDGYITDPKNADTDGDGYSDGLEAQWGTDPTDPNSKNELIWQLPLIFGISGAIIFIITLSKFIRRRNFNKKSQLKAN